MAATCCFCPFRETSSRLTYLTSCRWRYTCSSGAITRRSSWFPSICQESTTSKQIPCPESARHGRWSWSVYDPCLPSGASRSSTCLQHSPTDDSSSLYRRIQTPGPNGQWEGPPVCFPAIQDGPSRSAEDRSVTRSQGDSDCFTATGSFMVSRVDGSVSGRSNPAVRRGSNTVESRRCDRRRGDKRLVTTSPQIYTHGNSTGHPEGQGPFQGSCSHDVKVPSWLITPGVWISLGKICVFL